MAAINPIVLPKVTSQEVESALKLRAHVTTGIKPSRPRTAPSNGSSLGSQVSGGARISGGRG